MGRLSHTAGTPSHLPTGRSRNVVSGEPTATGVPPCTYLCSCFPTASVTTMPFSICFVSFPGPLRPANPGRRHRKGGSWFQEPTPKSKTRKTCHFGRRWPRIWPPGSSESKPCFAEATSRRPAGVQQITTSSRLVPLGQRWLCSRLEAPIAEGPGPERVPCGNSDGYNSVQLTVSLLCEAWGQAARNHTWGKGTAPWSPSIPS